VASGGLGQRGKVRRYGGFGGQRECLSGLTHLGCELLESAGIVQGEKACRGGGDDIRVATTLRQHRYGAGSCGVFVVAEKNA
jgi:hypothetical protein